MTVGLNLQYSNEGIIFLLIHPGEVDTDMMRDALGDKGEELKAMGITTISPAESAHLQLEVI